MSWRTNIMALMMAGVLSGIAACGSNVYAPLQSQDPADQAARYLEDGKPQKAIDLLEKKLADNPGEARYISILALAYAQRAGVAPIDFLDNMGSAQNSNTGLTNDITALFSVTPPATTSAIADVDYAISLLTSLSGDDLNDAEKLKLSLFQMASTVLKLKILDTDGNGQLSVLELLALSDSMADSIITGLQNAASALGGGGSGASTGGDVAAQLVSSMVSGITSQSGASSRDKLAGYVQQ
ncbi:hypothetical protein EBZ80_02545 [bacterium]|nr:hypothetical protein [bacterium]